MRPGSEPAADGSSDADCDRSESTDARAASQHWWITPPSKSHFSTAPVQEWVGLGDDGAGGLDPAATFRCTQFPGDVIYVPFDWGHAVLNLDETVGVALEFLVFREHLFPCGDECDD